MVTHQTPTPEKSPAIHPGMIEDLVQGNHRAPLTAWTPEPLFTLKKQAV